MDGEPQSINNVNVSNGWRELCDMIGVEQKLTFIGGGQMASALINGLIISGVVTKDDIAISVKTELSVERWKELGFSNVFTCNNYLLRYHGRGIVFLAVKPQMFGEVIEKLNKQAFSSTRLIVSIMASIGMSTLEAMVELKGYDLKLGIFRLMPNMPVLVRAGASILYAHPNLERKKIELVKSIMQYVGTCVEVNEQAFDAATAVAGCGPAFVFMAIEALADGGVLGGIDRATSMKLAAQTVMGAAKMMLELDKHPALLKDSICSAGGSTIQGVKELEKNGFRSALIEAVNASTRRSAGQI